MASLDARLEANMELESQGILWRFTTRGKLQAYRSPNKNDLRRMFKGEGEGAESTFQKVVRIMRAE